MLYENPLRKEKVEVEVPLRSMFPVEEMKREAEVPEYVNINDFQMKKAAAILWSLRHCEKVNGEVYSKREGAGIQAAFFGGAAYRLHCPTLNDKNSPFYRPIKDIDILIQKNDGRDFIELLCSMDKTLGSMFFHTVTSSDKRFNMLRRGDRYRLTTISDVKEDGAIEPGILELFANRLTFCHDFPLSEEIRNSDENYFTVGLENLMLLKTQFIKRVPKSEVSKEHEYRIMSEFGRGEFLIGMEDKDMRDVAGALLDHEVGKGNDCIDIDKLGAKVSENWGLWRTCTLNLENMRRNLDTVAKKFGMNQMHVDTIRGRLEVMLKELNNQLKPKKPFFASNSRQWWQDVEEQVR